MDSALLGWEGGGRRNRDAQAVGPKDSLVD